MMKRFYSFFAAVILLLTASSVKAHDYINETVQEGVKYYLYNVGANKFLNDNNGLDEVPTTLWTITTGKNGSLQSVGGKYVKMTAKGGFMGIGTTYTWTTNETSAATISEVRQDDGYYTIIGASLTSYLAADNNGIKNVGATAITSDDFKWVAISESQYKEISTLMDNVKFEYTEVGAGEFYIYNLRTGMFLNSGNNTLTNGVPTLWTLTQSEDGKYTIAKGNANVGATVAAEGLYDYEATLSTTAEEPVAFSIDGENKVYYLQYDYKALTYTQKFYLATEFKVEYDGTEQAMFVKSKNLGGRWLFVTKAAYDAVYKDRNNARERLNKAIEKAEAAHENPLPSIVKTNYTLKMTSAKYLKTVGGWSTTKVSDINNAAQGLEELTEQMLDITDVYAACKDAADHIRKVPGALSSIGGFLGDNVGLEICSTKEAMLQSIQTMRLASLASVVLTKFKAGDELTGLIQNHSFDTGDATGWNALTGQLNDASTAVLTDGMANGVGKYHFESNIFGLLGANTGERIMQPVLGLKKGDYSLKVRATSLSTLSNKIHLNAIVLPLDVVDINDWSKVSQEIITSLIKNLGTIIGRGIVKEASKDCSDKNALEEVELQFTLDADNPIIIAMNCGLTSVTGFNAFAADEVTLTYLGEGVITDINTVNAATGADTYYNIGGSAVAAPAKGINIQRTADGKVKKFIVK